MGIDNPFLVGASNTDCVEFEVLTFDIKKKSYYTTNSSPLITNHISDSFSTNNVSTKITHVGPKGKKHVARSRRDTADDENDKFVQTFLSSKFIGESGKITQFEAITAGPDLEHHASKRRETDNRGNKGDDYYIASDLMLEWQLSPIPELREQGINFEILTFDVKRSNKEKENDDDQKVVSQIQLVENDSNVITDAESGMIFEML